MDVRWRLVSQFNLKGLLIFLGAFSAWLGIHSLRVDRQRRAVETLTRNGAHVWYDDELSPDSPSSNETDGPNQAVGVSWRGELRGWLEGVLGRDHVADVVGVEFPRDLVRDSCLLSVGEIAGLEELRLVQCSLRSHGIRAFGRLRRLKRLNLSLSDISDSGLVEIGKLTQLEELNLLYTPVTDDGLKHLSSLSDLRFLAVSDRGSGPGISDRGVGYLSLLLKLEWLDIRGNAAVTDSSVPMLQNLRALRRLCVLQTSMSSEGVYRLQVALPECEITY